MDILDVDWERRRTNFRILMAQRKTNPTRLAIEAGLSANTLSKFANGSTETLSAASADKVLPLLGLTSLADLDTDNPISDPRMALKRVINEIPDADIPGLLKELQARFL